LQVRWSLWVKMSPDLNRERSGLLLNSFNNNKCEIVGLYYVNHSLQSEYNPADKRYMYTIRTSMAFTIQ
jgi:hypothetical protein